MNTITLSKSISGSWFVTDINTSDKKYSITKILGGKEIAHQSRYFSYKGYGGWVTNWWVEDTDLEKVKTATKENGYELILVNKVD